VGNVAAKDSIHIAPGAAEQLRALGLDTVEAALSYRGRRFAAISSTSETIEVFDPDADEHPPSVYLKRYRYPKRSQRVKAALRGSLFGRSRARFEFDRLQAMRHKGVPAIRPLAVGHRRVRGFVHAAILITEGVPGESLLSFARTHTDLAPRDRRTAIETLARQVRHMHGVGVVHGSLVWRDIIIRQTGLGEFTFAFLDPGPVKRFFVPGCRRLGYLRDVADLAATAQLLCSKADRLRFAKAYRGSRKVTLQGRAWLQRIQDRARRLVEQERHRMEVNDIFIRPGEKKG